MSNRKSTPARNGRPPDKRDAVVRHLRGLIVRGRLRPGDPFASRKAIERKFRASPNSVQFAMDILREEGFIETRHRRGTYVAPHPPHLCQFAFVFPYHPDRMPSQFYRAIHAEAERWQSPERRVLSFYDVQGHTDVEDYQRLLRYVESERLAGLIFASPPFGLRDIDSPIVRLAGLPRVIIETGADVDGCPTVYPDLSDFLPKAFDHLAARGCKRVAVVHMANRYGTAQEGNAALEAELAGVRGAAAACGLTAEPQWIQWATPSAGCYNRQLGRLLVQGAPGERPDGLVITDDNLVPDLTAGLAESGVKDVVVVAHTNFPHPTPSAVPVTRLGYDVRKLVATCMERIDQQRNRETAATVTVLPAMWEEEVGAAQPPVVSNQ